MGRRGPVPKPTAVNKVEGNKLHRTKAPLEPQPPVRLDEPPAFLGAEARNLWQWLGEELLNIGTMTTIDRPAFVLLCRQYETWVKATLEVARSQEVVVPKGSNYPMMNPWLVVANKAEEKIMKLLDHFGCTPAARTRIHITIRTPQMQKSGMAIVLERARALAERTG